MAKHRRLGVISVAGPFPREGAGGDDAARSPLGGRWPGASGEGAVTDWLDWPGWADDGDFDLMQEQAPADVPDDLGFPEGLNEGEWPGFPPEWGSSARQAGSAPGVDPDLGFGPGGSSESMPPGLALHARVEEAAARLGGMSDEGVVEVAAAARRLRARAEYLELRATREFARRRWECDPEPVKAPGGKWRLPGGAAEHAADELAFRLAEDRRASEDRMELSLALRDRLPQMDAMLAAGQGDAYRCQVVRDMTAALSDDDARLVDELVAPEAPDLRYTALRRLVARLVLRLDPDADRERRDRATRKRARVERFAEQSGNWALAGREAPLQDVLASEAHIQGLARYLRSEGVPGSLRELKVVIFFDLTQGRDPRTRIPGWDASHGYEQAAGPAGASGQSPPGPGVPRDHPGDPAGAGSGSARGKRGTGDPNAQVGALGGRRDRPGAGSRDEESCLSQGPGNREARNEGRYGDNPGDTATAGQYFGDSGANAADSANDDPDDDRPGPSGAGGGSRPRPSGQPGHCTPGGRAPFPASINLLVPVGSVYGWSSMPGEAGREIIDPATLRDMIQSASRHRNTRWCVTLVGADGAAVAHGCAGGQHPWDPPPGPVVTKGTNASPSDADDTKANDPSPGDTNATRAGHARHGPDGFRPPGDPDPGARGLLRDRGAGGAMPAERAPGAVPAATRLLDRPPAPAQLDHLEQFLRRLNVAFTPIAKDECDHQQAEARYRPSRKLQHLVRARDATCPAPGCGASSFHSDLDHTDHWPHGPTCQCNLGVSCLLY